MRDESGSRKGKEAETLKIEMRGHGGTSKSEWGGNRRRLHSTQRHVCHIQADEQHNLPAPLGALA